MSWGLQVRRLMGLHCVPLCSYIALWSTGFVTILASHGLHSTPWTHHGHNSKTMIDC